MRGACRKNDFGHRYQGRHLARRMAIATVRMDLNHFVGVIRKISFCIVLMRVVAEVLRALFTFMLAIRGRCCPGELERQQRKQEDKQEFFHGRNNIIEHSHGLLHMSSSDQNLLHLCGFFPHEH